MNQNKYELRPRNLEPEEVLPISIIIIILLILVSVVLYLTISSGGPTDPRATFYVIAEIATISVLVAILIAVWTREAMFLFYAVFPYALLILGGAVYYMILLSSIDIIGIFCIVSGHWVTALMLWIFKEELKSEKRKSAQTDTTSTTEDSLKSK